MHCPRGANCNRRSAGPQVLRALPTQRQGTPPGICGSRPDGRSPGSRIRCLPSPSRVCTQWPTTARFSAYSCGGSCGVGGQSLTAFPFRSSLEETVLCEPTKRLHGPACQRDTVPACGAENPVYSRFRRRFPRQGWDARRERGQRREPLCRGCPRNCRRRAALHPMPLEAFSGKAEEPASTREPVDRPAARNLKRPRVEGTGRQR
jgi:hypothetical protein